MLISLARSKRPAGGGPKSPSVLAARLDERTAQLELSVDAGRRLDAEYRRVRERLALRERELTSVRDQLDAARRALEDARGAPKRSS